MMVGVCDILATIPTVTGLWVFSTPARIDIRGVA